MQALKAALRNPSEAEIPENRKAYLRLVTAASKSAHVGAQPAQTHTDACLVYSSCSSQTPLAERSTLDWVISIILLGCMSCPGRILVHVRGAL